MKEQEQHYLEMLCEKQENSMWSNYTTRQLPVHSWRGGIAGSIPRLDAPLSCYLLVPLLHQEADHVDLAAKLLSSDKTKVDFL